MPRLAGKRVILTDAVSNIGRAAVELNVAEGVRFGGDRMPSLKRPTIDDVASLAGVSRATVSKVPRDAYGASDSTRQKVREAVDVLAYRPLAAARELRGSGVVAAGCVANRPHLSGLTGLRPCLLSHAPLDYLVIMLGTNDLKRRFSAEPEDISRGLRRLLNEVRSCEAVVGGLSNTLVVSPPAILEAGIFTEMFRGGREKSQRLAFHLEQTTREMGARFLDAGQSIASSPIDGIHFGSDQHERLGVVIAEALLGYHGAGAAADA